MAACASVTAALHASHVVRGCAASNGYFVQLVMLVLSISLPSKQLVPG